MNIVTLNDSPEMIAKAMGMAEVPAEKKSSGVTLPRLKIHNSAIMGTEEMKGKKVNIEKLSGGSFRIDMPDEGGVYFKEGLEIKPFAQRFMYKRWDTLKNNFVRSVMTGSLKQLRNMDVKDTDGGYNCGRPSGFMSKEEFDALPDNKKTLIRSAKEVRVILGVANFDGALKQEGEDLVEADLGYVPFVWDIQNQESSKDIDAVFAKCQQLNVNPLDFLTKIETSERKLPNGNSFYVTKSSLDLSNKVDRADTDEEHFVSFQSWIQGYNQFVIGKHHELAHTNESVDKELVESFIDITSDEKVQ